MIIEAMAVLIFLAPGGQPYYTQDPPLVLPKGECIAEAGKRNATIRHRTLMEYSCEVRG